MNEAELMIHERNNDVDTQDVVSCEIAKLTVMFP